MFTVNTEFISTVSKEELEQAVEVLNEHSDPDPNIESLYFALWCFAADYLDSLEVN